MPERFMIVTIKQDMTVIRKISIKLMHFECFPQGTANYFCIVWFSLPTISLSEPIMKISDIPPKNLRCKKGISKKLQVPVITPIAQDFIKETGNLKSRYQESNFYSSHQTCHKSTLSVKLISGAAKNESCVDTTNCT